MAKSYYLYKKPRDLDTCSEFSRKTVQERKEFAKTKGLCFVCLLQGHRSKECNQRNTCRTCGKSHLTSPYGASRKHYRNANNDIDSGHQIASTTLYTKTCFKSDHSSMIVPVWLYYLDDLKLNKTHLRHFRRLIWHYVCQREENQATWRCWTWKPSCCYQQWMMRINRFWVKGLNVWWCATSIVKSSFDFPGPF